MDARATFHSGLCARAGKRRVQTRAADHDVPPAAPVTPVGMVLPASDAWFLSGVTSHVTSECRGDRLIEWWEIVRGRVPHSKTLLITMDNGPEKHRRRPPCLQRVLACVECSHITIRLAEYPP
jgi:hypothetical protein